VSAPPLEQRIAAVLTTVAPDADPARLDPAIALREQIDFDSMDMLNFAAGLQREFGINVPDADLRELASLAGCARYLRAHLPGATAPGSK
jgi:acyl carrier protein